MSVGVCVCVWGGGMGVCGGAWCVCAHRCVGVCVGVSGVYVCM